MEYSSHNVFTNQVVTPLQKSLLNGSIEKIQQILCEKYGAKLALHTEDFHKCKEIVEICLDLQIDVNLPEIRYSTLLHFVAHELDEITLKSVLNRSTYFDINALYKGRALLHFVTEEEKEHLVKNLLEFGADVNVKDAFQETPLFYAIFSNNSSLVRLLLNYGATIYYKNFLLGFYRRPIAIWSLDKEIVKILLQSGYDVSEKNNGKLPIFKIFHTDICDSLFYVVNIKNWEMLKLLCAHGANMNLNDTTGTRILHCFCREGLLDEVHFSLKYGVDLFSIVNGKTALHSAVLANNYDLIDFLLRSGLDINAKYLDLGETPLQYKLSRISRDFYFGTGPKFSDKKREYVDMIEFLVDNGADVKVRDKNGLSPLEESIRCNILEITECFIGLTDDIEFGEILFNCRPELKGDIEIVNNSFNCRPIEKRKSEVYVFKILAAFVATKKYSISPHRHKISLITEFKWIGPFFEKCKHEVKEMKKTKICQHRNFSFFNFLSKDLMKVAVFHSCEEIMLVLESGKYKSHFPSYKFLFKKRIERVQLIRNYMTDLTRFIENFIKKRFPCDVLVIILSFLTAADLRNCGRALSATKK